MYFKKFLNLDKKKISTAYHLSFDRIKKTLITRTPPSSLPSPAAVELTYPLSTTTALLSWRSKMSTLLPLILSSTMSTSPSLQKKTIFYLSPGWNGHEGSSQMLQQGSARVSTSAILRLGRRSYLILSYLILS